MGPRWKAENQDEKDDPQSYIRVSSERSAGFLFSMSYVCFRSSMCVEWREGKMRGN
jgi:hypothetical protein